MDKRIMIFAPVSQREWCLPYYLRNLYNLNYKKENIRMVFVLNNSTDRSYQFLETFKTNYGNEYESVDIQIWNNSNIIGDDCRETEHREKYTYQWLADLRNRGVFECIKNDCDYLLSCDSDILVKPDLLKNLVTLDKDYVAGLIYNGYMQKPGEPWVAPNVLKKDVVGYTHINNYYTKNKKSLIEVSFTGAVFLCSKKALPFLKFDYDKMGEDLPACQSLEKNGFKLYCSCDNYCQHIMDKKFLDQFKNFGVEE